MNREDTIELLEENEQLKAEVARLRNIVSQLETSLINCSPMSPYPSEEWDRFSQLRHDALAAVRETTEEAK